VTKPPALPASQSTREETGVLSAFVAVLIVALLAIVGLAVDSGRAISAQRVLADEASQAARAGASRLSVSSLRDGRLAINDACAVQTAEQFMASFGHPGTARVRDGVVTVQVVEAVPTTILGMVGVRTITVSATASASNVSGVTGQG
jgi:Flp pilus assembly protein TadG